MYKMDQTTTKKYVITGKYYNSNKNFSAIYTDTPQHYNLWRGNVWMLIEDENGIKHRKLLYSVFN